MCAWARNPQLIRNALTLQASVISVNFQGGRNPADGPDVHSDQFAGYIVASEWDNVQDNWSQVGEANKSGSLLNMKDSSGSATVVDLAYESFGTWDLQNGDGSGNNEDMMSGFLDNFGVGASNLITFSDISYAKYDVYVYFNRTSETYIGFSASDNAANNQTLYARYSGASYTDAEGFIVSEDSNVGDGWTSANVIKFSGFTGSSFTLDNATNPGAPNSAGGYKSIISGIQIVAVPEPSSTSLIGLGALACLLRRRR